MQIRWLHGEDDSGSKCPGFSSSRPEGQSRNGGHVALRLSAQGTARDSRTSNPVRISRAPAQAQPTFRPHRHQQPAARRACRAMIVLDASAMVDWLLQTPAGQRIEQRIYARNETLHSVHLLDVEFTQVLRRLVRERTLIPKRADEAMEDLMALRITRYAPVLLLSRIWQLS